MLWFRTYVPGSNPRDDNKVFFHYLVIMYLTLNSIDMQFEYQYPQVEQCLYRACAGIKGNV